MSRFDWVEKPTLILDETVARHNIKTMSLKAQAQGIRFRPHFKTHQSAEIGTWFRQVGIRAITVSSIDMAQYFFENGWQDITIAFSVNQRQIGHLNRLAAQIKLGLLVESSESVLFLHNNLLHPCDIWIKVDTGAQRTGLSWQEPQAVIDIAKRIQKSQNTNLRGLLTHAGQTYQAHGTAQICPIYHESVARINQVHAALTAEAFRDIEISVGDTPGCSVCPDLGQVDEIRPGNFIFYDAQQLQIGACRFEDIAVAVACPVVAKHPARHEVVVFGGAIHLSKDTLMLGEQKTFGLVAFPQASGWGVPIKGGFVRALSQEHGIIHLPAAALERIQIGDLLFIIPAHSCLTVQLMRAYHTRDGGRINTLNCV